MATRPRDGWAAKPFAIGPMPPEAVERIVKLRRLMLIHSYVYYELDENLVTDHCWMAWAQELAVLQQKHGRRVNFYDTAFEDWDGSSGFQLPMNDPDVHRVAARLLHARDNQASS